MVYTIVVHLRAKSDKESIAKLKAKLLEASAVYSKDKETISWFVMQSVFDSREFTIVERYEQESSQQYHLNNPYWKTFVSLWPVRQNFIAEAMLKTLEKDPYVIPLLDGPMDLRRFEELTE